MEPEIEILSVSDLNQSVRMVLEEDFSDIWVKGEVSNFVAARSGHWYFTLKDDAAQVRCAMFRGANHKIKFTPEEGMEILIHGNAGLYAARGDYQIIVNFMEESGLGALQKAFDALKKKLAKDGLFDVKHKKPLPEFIERLGVITSPTGAAIRDVLSVLKRRFPGLPVIIYPSLVQGKEAASSIVNAIQKANVLRQCDVLLLTRGGGSLEDLWPFNEEVVARAIYESQLPIVSAVGHEIDTTISDFVADAQAPTPSAAAELLSPDKQDLLSTIARDWRAIASAMQNLLQHKKRELFWLAKQVKHPKTLLQEKNQRLDYIDEKLRLSMTEKLKTKAFTFEKLAGRLDALSPLAVLGRGYSITTNKQGQTIKSAKRLQAGDVITTRFEDGSARSIVKL